MRILLGCALLLAVSDAHALVHAETDELTLDVSGSAKLFPLSTVTPPSLLNEREMDTVGFGSLRSNGLLQIESLSLEAAYHVFPVVGEGVGTTADIRAPGLSGGLVSPITSRLRVVDFDRELVSERDFVLLQNFDRLLLTVLGPGGSELRVGRQAINHGSARILTATDIFSPFSPATLDSEFKQGLDAVRLTVPFGELTEVELYAVLADRNLDHSLQKGVYVARVRHTFPELVDVSMYAGTSYASPTVALDVSGDLGGATVYGEALLRWWDSDAVDALSSVSGDLPLAASDSPTVRATLGGQYFFPFDLDVIVELHWNGAGESAREQYLSTLLTPDYAVGEIYLLGRAHVATAWSYLLTDLSRLSLSTITSVVDGSTLLTPAYYWDAAENASLSAGAILGLGRRVDTSFVADEFGYYPYVFFVDARYYF